MTRTLTCQLIAIVALFGFCNGDRIKDMIYVSVDGVAACFRRHNGTHQFGCSSSRLGSVGVIHLLENENDLKWLESNGTAGPYTVVMPFTMFKKPTLMKLKATNNINGVLLTRNSTEGPPSYYSPEDTCPNRYSNYIKCNDTKPWNPVGSSLLLEDWPFPMFYLQNETLLGEIKKCFYTYNDHDREVQSKRSLCALEMKSYMFAALNSVSCMKRSNNQINSHPTQFCDPLGDRNIHWPVAPLTDRTKSVVMVVARIDSSSMFDGFAPGANSAITGLVTLIATAYYFNNLKPTIDQSNVIFTLLNGEAFDYIGSGRLVYDLSTGNFNSLGGKTLRLEDISTVIELNQLGDKGAFLHTKNMKNDSLIQRLSKSFKGQLLENSVPPTSVQSFLAGRSDISTLVITGYQYSFANKYYHGILDDGETLGFNKNNSDKLASSLTSIAMGLAEELYANVTGKTAPKGNDSEIATLISEMLFCYLTSAKCSLFRSASAPGAKLVNHALPLYVGVSRVPNFSSSLTAQLLVLLTGEQLSNMDANQCYDSHLAWMAGYNISNPGVCINSTVNFSIAVSPAFTIDDYDFKSGLYSTWTESVWQSLSVRMFLKPSAATERLSMIFGSTIAVIAIVIVWFINSRADVLFNSRSEDW